MEQSQCLLLFYRSMTVFLTKLITTGKREILSDTTFRFLSINESYRAEFISNSFNPGVYPRKFWHASAVISTVNCRLRTNGDFNEYLDFFLSTCNLKIGELRIVDSTYGWWLHDDDEYECPPHGVSSYDCSTYFLDRKSNMDCQLFLFKIDDNFGQAVIYYQFYGQYHSWVKQYLL